MGGKGKTGYKEIERKKERERERERERENEREREGVNLLKLWKNQLST